MQRTGILSFHELPPELVQHALQFVLPKDLCNVALTSTSMRTLASDPNLWTEMEVKKKTIKELGLVQLFSITRFRKIRKIDLSHHPIFFGFGTSEHLQSDLNAIASSSVEDLNLEYVDFKDIPAEVLARAVGHLHKLNLNNTRLNSEQILAVLDAWISSSTLVDVSLKQALLNIPSQILAQAVGRLPKVDLSWTRLTNEQILAVLDACINSSTLLDVSLDALNLRNIPSQILAQAVGHLQKVNLSNTGLTSEQILAILESCIISPTLVEVLLMGVDLKGIPTEILAQASNKITFHEWQTWANL